MSNLTITFSSGTGASSGYVRVGHNTSVTNEDAVWSFTLGAPVTSLTFDLTWNNTAAGTGWQGKYVYAFALSTDGTAGKQLAKGSTNIVQELIELSGKTGAVTVTFNTSLNAGVYYLRANFNGSKYQTMKAFSETVTGSAVSAEGEVGGGGVPARKIYIEKSIKKADDDNTVDRMVMVGYSGFMTRTTNGTSWSSVTTGTAEDLYGINSVGGAFVAVGSNGTIAVSQDSGATWTRQTISTVSFESATYSNGLWVVAGGNEIWVSTDLTTWTMVLQVSVYINHLEGVIWDGQKYIAYGMDDKLFISNDGYSWDQLSVNGTNIYGSMSQMIKAEGYLYTIAYIPIYNKYGICRSKDGYRWEIIHYVVGISYINIAYGDGRWLAVGESGLLSYSDDGLTWTDYTYQATISWNAVGYGFGRFVIGGIDTNYDGYRALSTDGENWTGLTTLSSLPTNVAFGLSKYHYDIQQACLDELYKRMTINKVEGEVENSLPPKYGDDYKLGDIVEVNAAGWQGRQRITKVRHVLEPNRVSITPVIGDDFLDLRQFINREVNK